MLGSLTEVQHALTDRIEGRDVINNRSDHIKRLVGQFHEGSLTGETALKNAYEPLDYWYKTGPDHELVEGKRLEEFEDTATAYLVYRLEKANRDPGKEVKKKTQLLGKDYHPFGAEPEESDEFTIREEQIRAIVALLQKDHLQSPTGSGKSSVILPIASLVKAISENGPVAVTTVSDELSAELLEKITAFNAYLPQGMQIQVTAGEPQDSKDSPDEEEKTTRFIQQLAKAEIEGTPDPEVQKTHFESRFGNLAPQKSEEGGKKAAGIRVFNEKDFIFWQLKNPGEYVHHTYFDEIHVPFDRATPYYLEGSGIPTQGTVKSYLFDRILSGIIEKRIQEFEERGEIVAEKGIHFFKKEGEKELQDSFYSIMGFDWNDEALARDYLEPVIEEVAGGMAQDTGQLKKWFVGQWTQDLEPAFAEGAPSASILEQNIHETFTSLMRARNIRTGVDYMLEHGRVTSRDPMMGISLPTHEYSPEILLALQTLEHEVRFINYAKTAAGMTSLEGFIANNLKGRLSGLSGTLLTQTFTSDKPHKTSLARFLERFTNHDVYSIEAAKPKYVPDPRYIENPSRQLQEMFAAVQENAHRPVAIFTFNEEEGQEMVTRLEQTAEGRDIIFISHSIDEVEARQKYREFADSDHAILISTGRVGVGVDIKKSNGEHPDFLTVVSGLPEATTQFFQALGRRRLLSENPEKDFAWFFHKDHLSEHRGFGLRENEEKEVLLDKFHHAGKKYGQYGRGERLNLIEEIVHRAEAQKEEEDKLKVQFDEYYKAALEGYGDPKNLVGFIPSLEKESREPNGYFEREVMARFSEDERVLLEHILSLNKPGEKPELITPADFRYPREEVGTPKTAKIDPKFLKANFYNFVGNPASLYYTLRHLFYQSPGAELGQRMGDFQRSAKDLFNRKDLLNEWLSMRSDAFVELMKNSASYLKEKVGVSDIENRLRAGKARFALYYFPQIELPSNAQEGRFKVFDPTTGFYFLQINYRDRSTNRMMGTIYSTPVSSTSRETVPLVFAPSEEQPIPVIVRGDKEVIGLIVNTGS